MNQRIYSIVLVIFSIAFCFNDKEMKKINSSSFKIVIEKKIRGISNGNDSIYFAKPTDVIKTEDNNYVFVDNGSHQLIVTDRNINFKRFIGKKGKGPLDFINPYAIAADSKGNLFITEEGNKRIQILDKHFNYLNSFGSKGVGTFALSINNNDNIVMHSLGENKKVLKVFNNKGKEIDSYIDAYKVSEDWLVNQYNNAIEYCFSHDTLFSVNTYHSPILSSWKNGKELKKNKIEIDFKPQKIKLIPNRMGILGDEDIVSGICIYKNNLLVLIKNRYMNEPEKKIVGGQMVIGGETVFVPRKNLPLSRLDLFSIMIFNKKLDFIGKVKLPFYVNIIKCRSNDLFLIDSSLEAIIYKVRLEQQ